MVKLPERKAPLSNGVAAVGNLLEALFWFGAYYQHPSADNCQSLVECGVSAVENIATMVASYCPHKDSDKNALGGCMNIVVGIVHSLASYATEHLPDWYFNNRPYAPRSISRIVQPSVNLICTGINAFEAYEKKGK